MSDAMSDASDARVILLSDRSRPQPTKAEKLREQTIQLVEHYMVQIPEMMGRAIGGALMAYDAGRREEFAATVAAVQDASPEVRQVLDTLLLVFGPRPVAPMAPAQPEQAS